MCERERERERCACVCERERERDVRVCERDRERDVRVCVCERERERKRDAYACVCVCMKGANGPGIVAMVDNRRVDFLWHDARDYRWGRAVRFLFFHLSLLCQSVVKLEKLLLVGASIL